MNKNTNWLAIAVAVVASMFLGFMWYGFLFDQQWMAGNGITQEGDKYFKNGAEMPMDPTPMIVNTLAMVVYALAMNWLLRRMNVTTWAGGATAGAVVGGIMLFGIATGHMFAGAASNLILVDGLYSLVLFTLVGAIVGGWQKRATGTSGV